MENKTSAINTENLVTKDYCSKCSQYHQSQIESFEKLFDEKFKSIRNQTVIAVTTATTILGVISIAFQIIQTLR